MDSSGGGRSDSKMGEVDVEVGAILRLEGQEKKLALNEGGSIFVHITESITGQDDGIFSCHIRGLDIKNIERGFFGLGAIDPYFELKKKYVDANHGITRWHTVYRSEHIPDTINPYWNPFHIDLERLCHNNLGKELKLSVWDKECKGGDRWLGAVEVSVEEFQTSVTRGGNANRELALRVENEEQEIMGLLVVLKAEIVPSIG